MEYIWVTEWFFRKYVFSYTVSYIIITTMSDDMF